MVNIWLKNNKPFKDRAVFRLAKKIPLHCVVGNLKVDDIHRMVLVQHPDVEKGNKSYPGLFQKAVTEYIGGLGEDEKAEFEKIKEEWQTRSPPREVQLK